MSKKIAAWILALGLLVGAAGQALAYGEKSGYLYRSDCTIQPSDPWVTSRSTGTTNLLGAGRSYYVQYVNGTTYRTRAVSGAYNGGYWRVYTSGTLVQSETTGYCRNP